MHIDGISFYDMNERLPNAVFLSSLTTAISNYPLLSTIIPALDLVLVLALNPALVLGFGFVLALVLDLVLAPVLDYDFLGEKHDEQRLLLGVLWSPG